MSSASISQSLSQWLRQRLSDVANLPPAGESWQTSETDLSGGDINLLRSKGVIRRIGWDGEDRVWETDRAAWDAIQERREDLGVLSCGHRPFSTVDLDSDEPYSCLGDGCDARYSREEIEAVIGGE